MNNRATNRSDLSDYQPTSMLHVRETRVERALYPVIDCPHPHYLIQKVGQRR